jgi:cytosol alanyl aminopeptidase
VNAAVRTLTLFVSALALVAGCATETSGGPPSAAPGRGTAPIASAARPSMPPPPRDDGRLPGSVRPEGYQLRLDVDPGRPRFSGTVLIPSTVTEPTTFIVLHARNLTIERAEVRQKAARVPALATSRNAAGGKGEPEELVLSLPQVLEPGPAEIEIAFEGPFDESLQGLYRVEEGGAHYAFTQFEPTDARRAFPCFDEPGFKVPIDLTLEIPRGLRAVANSAERDVRPSADGARDVVRFETTRPLPSYLLAFAVGPLDVREHTGGKTPIRLITTKGKGDNGAIALDAAAALLAELETYFGAPYAYGKLDIAAVPDFAAGAMENPGLVTFREELLLLDPTQATTEDHRRTAEVIAHELAHQWFGNLVTARWWDDLWLNEGMATWVESKMVDVYRPAFHSGEEALAQKLEVMDLDVLPSARAVRQPVRSTSEALEAFDEVTYVKGAAVLRMIEGWVGPDAFRTGIQGYLRANQHKNATAGDLMDFLGRASGSHDVGAVASTFLDKPGLPRLSVELLCEKDGKSPRVRIATTAMRTGPGADKPGTWRFPACFAFDAKGRKTQCVEIDPAAREIPLQAEHCPAWIFPNADDRGYYRYSLTPADWDRLLRSHLAGLVTAERVSALSDAWALVRAGSGDSELPVRMLRELTGNRERLVVEGMSNLLHAMSEDVLREEDRAAFARLVREVFGPTAARVGWVPDPFEQRACPRCDKTTSDELTLLRTAILEALAFLGEDKDVQKRATDRAKAYLEGSKDVRPENGRLALRIAARHPSSQLFDALVKRATAADATPQDRIAAR